MNINLLELLARMAHINPAIYDLIPRGPQAAMRPLSAGETVELNPQPIPPGVQLQFEAVRVAHEIALAAIAAEAAGNDEAAERIVARAVDDFCGTPPRHRPIPWPDPWPYPSQLHMPDPIPWLVDTVRLVAALTLASIGAQAADGVAREALGHGAERLMEIALSGRSEKLREPALT